MDKVINIDFSRLRLAREMLGVNQTEASKISGVRQKDISDLEAGNKKFIPPPYIQYLYESGIDLNSLFGTGEICLRQKPENAQLNAQLSAQLTGQSVRPIVNPSVHLRSQNVDATVGPSVDLIPKNYPERVIQPVVVTMDSKGKENIVFVDIKAAAGYATNYTDREYFRHLPTFSLPGKRYQSGTFRCFEVEGDSMRGSLRPGEWVISRYIDDFAQIRDNFVYVVITQEGVIVKRVLNRIKERGRLVFKSDNPAYPLYELAPDQVREIWLGVGKFVFDLSNQELDIHRNMDSFQLELMDLRYRMDKLEGKDTLPPPQKK